MKKLFTVKKDGCLWVEVEGSVYSTFGLKNQTFYDSEGNKLENYSRPPVQEDEPVKIDDPDYLEDIGAGFYVYTTHEVTYDVDGKYGQFGIKYNDGRKLTEEIYYQIGRFCHGLCAVSIEDGKWGCIDANGRLVIPYNFNEEMFFNEYGVAVGNRTLIDRMGNEIPDTALNSIDDCAEYSRYFVFSLLSDEQLASIDECGTAPNVMVDIYDTKNRAYVVKGVPECRLEVYCFDGEPEVILAAVELLDQYDKIDLSRNGTIICEKDSFITVYDYYQ